MALVVVAQMQPRPDGTLHFTHNICSFNKARIIQISNGKKYKRIHRTKEKILLNCTRIIFVIGSLLIDFIIHTLLLIEKDIRETKKSKKHLQEQGSFSNTTLQNNGVPGLDPKAL